MWASHLVILPYMVDVTHLGRIGVDTTLAIKNNGIVIPGTFPQLVEYIQVFIRNLVAVVMWHFSVQSEVARSIEEVDEREVPVAKPLGFKPIPAKDEKHVAGFMAILEEQFGLDGMDSFVAFAKQMVSTY